MMNYQLPQDKAVWCIVIKTKLRNQYHDLDALGDDLGSDKEKIIQSLGSIGYEYNSELNRFC